MSARTTVASAAHPRQMLAALSRAGLSRAASGALPSTAHLLHLCSSFSSSSSSGDAGAGQATPPQPLGAVPQPSVVSIKDDCPTAQHTTAAQQRPPKVLSVGGSIAGCCLALALGRVGCEVSAEEAPPREWAVWLGLECIIMDMQCVIHAVLRSCSIEQIRRLQHLGCTVGGAASSTWGG